MNGKLVSLAQTSDEQCLQLHVRSLINRLFEPHKLGQHILVGLSTVVSEPAHDQTLADELVANFAQAARHLKKLLDFLFDLCALIAFERQEETELGLVPAYLQLSQRALEHVQSGC